MDVQYKIVGGDGTEYGPATLDELKTWIRDGRVAAMTQVWRSDLGFWSQAERYTELHEELGRLQASVAAVVNRDLPPAGFWARLAAYIIDFVLLAVLFFSIWTPLATAQHWEVVPAMPTEWTDAGVAKFSAWRYHALPVFYPIFLLYDVLLNGRFGATFGKMLIGARITMLDGSPIGYGRALLRWFAARLSDFFFFGYFLIAFRRDKRALHDLLAGTKVVFKR